MKRIEFVFCLGLLGCGASDPGGATSEVAQVASQALVQSPTLTAYPGLVCSTRASETAPTLNAGQLSFTYPRSRAVMGGSGIGSNGTVAQSRVTFTPTAFSQSIVHGTSQRVCAEVGARSACDATYACWYGDGRYTIESNATARCEPAAESASSVLASGSSSLPALALNTSHTIHLSVTRGTTDHFTAQFYKNGALQTTLSVDGTFNRSATLQGFSGFRADRVALNVLLYGTAPFSAPATSGAWQFANNVRSVASQVSPTDPPLGCSYLAPPVSNLTPTLQSLENPSRSIGATWQPPYGVTSQLGYVGFQDGRFIDNSQGDGLPFLVPDARFAMSYHELLDTNYLYEIGYEQDGVLSELVPTFLSPGTSPIVSLRDHDVSIGVGLFTYVDAPAPAQPYTREQVRGKIFSDTGFTLTSYLRDVSRNQATISGDVSPWLIVRYLSGPNAGQPIPFAEDCPAPASSDPHGRLCRLGASDVDTGAKAQAAAAGFSLTGFDRNIYLIRGEEGDQAATYVEMGASTEVTDSDGLPALGILVHEFGHALSFGHSYGASCPGANFGDAAASGCTNAGSRSSSLRQDRYDAQIQAGQPLYRWHSLHQSILGWLTPAEQAVHFAGQADADYVISSLSSNGAGLRHLRVEVEPNAFYFVEFRTRDGFDAPGPNAQTNTTSGVPYRDPTGVSVWVHAPIAASNFNRIASAASNLLAGDAFCDPFRKLSIRVTAVGSTTATVRVEHKSDPCGHTPAFGSCTASADCAWGSCRSGLCSALETNPVTLATGDGFSCSTFGDGKVRCWGRNERGQLGIAAPGPIGDAGVEMGTNLQPVSLPGNAVKVVAGNAHACALLEDGRVNCWGGNDHGQLGVGDTTDRVGGSVNADLGGIAESLVAGGDFSCAVVKVEHGTDAATHVVKCWGDNSSGQLGIGSRLSKGDDPGEMGAALLAVALPYGEVGDLSAGRRHVCVVMLNDDFSRDLRCWGSNDSGELGGAVGPAFGDAPTELTPQPISLGTGFRPYRVAAGNNHTCVMTLTGLVKCWGSSMFGECGYGDMLSRGAPASTMGNNLPYVPLGFAATGLTAGMGMTCATGAGGVKCWGVGSYGFGQPALTSWDSIGDQPGEIAALPFIDLGSQFGQPMQVATSGDHVCARAKDQRVKCWGLNAMGQLGLGDTNIRGDQLSDMGNSLPFLALP